MMKKKLLAMGLALTMSLGLASCSSPAPAESAPPADSAAPVSSEPADSAAPTTVDSLIMGTSADYPPFEFHILKDGVDTIVGIDVSVGQQIAADMGAEFSVVHMDFDNLLTLMAQGNCDIVIAAMELDKDGERSKAADCSDPYYSDLPPKIVVKAGNEAQYTSLDGFSGKVVGAQTGTTKVDVVNDQMPGAELLSMASVVDLVNNLVYDKCDALVLDGAVAQKYLDSNDQLAGVDIDMGEAAQPYRVWVAKGDPKGLLPSINATIAKITADDTMTTYIEEANELSSQALAN